MVLDVCLFCLFLKVLRFGQKLSFAFSSSSVSPCLISVYLKILEGQEKVRELCF